MAKLKIVLNKNKTPMDTIPSVKSKVKKLKAVPKTMIAKSKVIKSKKLS